MVEYDWQQRHGSMFVMSKTVFRVEVFLEYFVGRVQVSSDVRLVIRQETRHVESNPEFAAIRKVFHIVDLHFVVLPLRLTRFKRICKK